MLIETLGWVGTAGTFGAYLLLSRGWLASHSLTYSLLNVAGGLLAGGASVAYSAWPSVVSNLVWAAIGLHAASQTLLEDWRTARLEEPHAEDLGLPRVRAASSFAFAEPPPRAPAGELLLR